MSDSVQIPAPAPPQALAGLGRLPAVDVRDRRFSMPSPPSARTFRNWLSPTPIWDQGGTSMCVSYAVNRFLVSHRIVNDPPMPLADFYRECQLIDEWPGEGYDGTSVRAGFKVLSRLGFVSSYSWAQEVEPIARHILEIGPVVVGFDWTIDMFMPDRFGYIWPHGQVVGGHAFMLNCCNRRRKNPDGSIGAFRMTNSWSAGWGQGGRAWMTFDVVQQLLEGLSGWPGEAATAVEASRG